MPTVLVTGATGQVGRLLIPLLRGAGQRVRATSRSAQAVSPDRDWYVVDWESGSDLTDALAGVDTVVHCASGSPKGERQTMAALLGAGRAAASPPHVVYFSIVGVDQLSMPYYTAKLEAERALSESGLPFTILRATQFHSLISSFLRGLTRLPVVLMPKGIAFQPISLEPVAARLAELAGSEPQGRVPDLGGPEVLAFRKLAEMYLAAAGRSKRIVEIPIPGRLMKSLRAGRNLAPENATPGQTFAEYLASR